MTKNKNEAIKAVVAIEKGEELGLTPFQVGVAMGVRNIILGRDSHGKKVKKPRK